MNKSAIRNFAVGAREQLIEAAKQRAYEYEITENGENKTGIDTIGGRLLTADEKKQRQQLIAEIGRKGYTQVMEEAAYTWFNRFIALRYMEVNGFLPSKVRVFTDENGAFKPEILKEAMTVEIDGLDRDVVLDLLDKQNNEELYKYLLITQCNALNQGLPYMFEKISNWTELLFPANLLRPDSVLGQMVTEIPEEDWQDAVQIIGWLYQYYNSELKDDTFALLKKNVKITKERIPAATQLFTPDWIVRYMVENSLGRLWYEGHPNFDKSQWKYYLDEAPQEPEVELQLQKIRADYANMKPEDIKVIDPCMGSGHILVYAFDVLLQIYTSCGWSERDAAKSIIENNLYGLDIDDRAGQLAYFAVMMKARKYSRRILNGETKPNVLAIQDSGFMTDDFIAYVAEKDQHMKADLTLLRTSLKDAKEYGSIINMPKLNCSELYERIDIISRSFAEDIFQIEYQRTATEQLQPLVKQAEIMAQKYDVVVTNPPYMGSDSMSAKLKDFVLERYPDSRYDLYACCVERFTAMMAKHGLLSMITQHSFMYAYCFRNFRQYILHNTEIKNAIHLGARAFEEISGEVVQCIAFTLTKDMIGTNSVFVPLADYTSDKEKYFHLEKRLSVKATDFATFDNSIFAYSLTPRMKSLYLQNKKIGDVFDSKAGVVTGNDDYFLRYWFEVLFEDFDTNATGVTSKYVPYSKGGTFVKWFGNIPYALKMRDLYNNALVNKSVRRGDVNAYYKPCIGWSQMGGGNEKNFSFLSGCVCGTATPTILFHDLDAIYYILGFLNTKIPTRYIKAFNPLLSTYIGDICNLPYIINKTSYTGVLNLVSECISTAQSDGATLETSWDFKKHPLV